MRNLRWVLGATCFAISICGATPSSADLAGRWDGNLNFGKVKLKLNLKVVVEENGKRVKVTMDNPEQGMKDLPVNAMLYNPPEVRLEIDQFGTAFNGKLLPDGSAIAGEFEEGPGGRPIEVTFKKNTAPEKPEAPHVYTFKEGEAKDYRGYWKTTLEAMPGTKLQIGLRVGKDNEGRFHPLMDIFEQGSYDLPASDVVLTNGGIHLVWQLFQITYDGKLEKDGDELAGKWKQGPKETPLQFTRLSKAATAMPAETSFEPDKTNPQDPRGEWKGTLDIDGNQLRLVFKVGKVPHGGYAGTLASLDQGGRELLISSIGYTNPVLRVECKMIRGNFTGNVNKDGTEIEGSWEQFGKPSPLKLVRVNSAKSSTRN